MPKRVELSGLVGVSILTKWFSHLACGRRQDNYSGTFRFHFSPGIFDFWHSIFDRKNDGDWGMQLCELFSLNLREIFILFFRVFTVPAQTTLHFTLHLKSNTSMFTDSAPVNALCLCSKCASNYLMVL